MSLRTLVFAAAGGLALLTPAEMAQVAWTVDQSIRARADHATAFDSARGRLVMFGGVLDSGEVTDETWEWDGVRWTERQPAVRPRARRSHRMVYDEARQRIVMYGGTLASSQMPNAETWEWDGNNWTQVVTTAVPFSRYSYGMVYDKARQVTVLFGGNTILRADNQTWLYDGTSWIQQSPQTTPPPLVDHGMAYDDSRAEVIVFGGSQDNGTPTSETWTWDGSNWAQRLPANAPPARSYPAMAWDPIRQRIVLHGGAIRTSGTLTTALEDTWEWDGNDWEQRSTSSPGIPFIGISLHWDPGRQQVSMPAGFSNRGYRRDTYSWTGSAWVNVDPMTSPPARRGARMVWHDVRRSVILFGGFTEYPPHNDLLSNEQPIYHDYDDLWEWKGDRWAELTPASRPPGRHHHGLSYDSARDRIVLFGGSTRSTGQWWQDTWEWDGSSWIQRNPPNRPANRFRHAMAYDENEGRTIISGPVFPSDTWAWDGEDWEQLDPANSPSLFERPSTYSRSRGEILWGTGPAIWRNGNWESNPSPVYPPSRSGSAMAFDEARRVAVLFGGVLDGGQRGEINDTWEWNGSSWVERFPTNPPPADDDYAMGYHMETQQIVMIRDRIWFYGPVNPADFDRFGHGCPGSLGTPQLDATPGELPWLDDSFSLTVSSVPPGQLISVAIGTSNTTWSGIPLPLSLGFVGMTGCAALVSGDFFVPVANQNGAGVLSLGTIPSTPSLVGQSFYAQAWVSDGSNPGGWVVSNGGQAIIGSK